jgi:hypothetical protein
MLKVSLIANLYILVFHNSPFLTKSTN